MLELKRQLVKLKNLRHHLAFSKVHQRNRALFKLANLLLKYQQQILRANQKDLRELKRGEMRDRLLLTAGRIKNMVQGVRAIAKLPDPLNKILEQKRLPNGLSIQRLSVPLGTIGVIYESRPNVTVDLAALAIKSGNAIALKGGSESFKTNKILVKLIQQSLNLAKLPRGLVRLVDSSGNWKAVLLSAHGLVDVLIPRGGEGLIKWVRENSHIPVIETGAGVCHTFVDSDFSFNQAVNIIINAKTQRPSVCNALDTLVVHKKALKRLLPAISAKLAKFKVEIFADSGSYGILKPVYPLELLKKAGREHFGKEFLSLKMAIKTVENFGQALQFIKNKTSGHSEAILSKNSRHIRQFLGEIDAAAIYANASTRFTDGGEFGMGAEVGVSTQKLHARGPMGLEALTSYKWIVFGNGQVRK